MAAIFIYSAILVLMALVALRRPACMMGLVICNYGVQQWTQSQSSFFVQNHSLTNYITAVALFYAIILKWVRGERPFANYPATGWLTLALFLFAFTSAFWSIDAEVTLLNFTISWRTLLIFLVLCPLLISTEDDLRVGLHSTLILGAILLVLLATTADWSGRFVKWSDAVYSYGERIDGGNPLAIASLAATTVAIAVLLNFSGIGRVWQIARWALAALGAGVCIRAARGQSMALLLVLVAFLPMSRRMKSIKEFLTVVIGLTFVGAIAFWAFENFAQTRHWQRDVLVGAYQGGRLDTTLRLLGAWANGSPVTWLIGLGSSASYHPNVVGFYPHFVLFEILGEEGLVGFAIFIALLALTARNIRRLYRTCSHDRGLRGLLAATAALFLLDFILSCKQGSMIGTTQLFAFAIILGRWELIVRRRMEGLEPALGPNTPPFQPGEASVLPGFGDPAPTEAWPNP